MIEIDLCSVFSQILGQRGNKLRNAENRRARKAEIDVNIIQDALATPVIA